MREPGSFVLSRALHVGCAMGHTELVEYLLAAFAAESAEMLSYRRVLESPPCVKLPGILKNMVPNPVGYAIAFNQHALVKCLLTRMSLQGNPPQVESKIIIATPANELESSSSQRVFSIQINESMLIELLDTCAAYGAFECAQLLVDSFHAAIPAALHRFHYLYEDQLLQHQRSANLKVRLDFPSYALQHGPRMMSIFDTFEEMPLSELRYGMELFEEIFEKNSFPLFLFAMSRSIDYIVENLEESLILSSKDEFSTLNHELNSSKGIKYCKEPYSLEQFLYKLLTPCFHLVSGFFARANEKVEGNNPTKVEDLHELMPHWRELHECTEIMLHVRECQLPAKFERLQISPEEAINEDMASETLLKCMKKMLDLEIRCEEIRLFGLSSEGNSFRIPPVAFCICTCLIEAIESCSHQRDPTVSWITNKMTAFSQVLHLLLEHLERFSLEIRCFFFGLLTGPETTDHHSYMDGRFGYTRKPIDKLMSIRCRTKFPSGADCSITELIRTLLNTLAIYWKSDNPMFRNSQRISISELDTQQECSSPDDPFIVLTTFCFMGHCGKLSFDETSKILWNLFEPCVRDFTPITVTNSKSILEFVKPWYTTYVNCQNPAKHRAIPFSLFHMSRLILLACTRPAALSFLEQLVSPVCLTGRGGCRLFYDAPYESATNNSGIPSISDWLFELSTIWYSVMAGPQADTTVC